MNERSQRRGPLGAVGAVVSRGFGNWLVGLVGVAITLFVVSIFAIPQVRAPVAGVVCAPAFMETACQRLGLLPGLSAEEQLAAARERVMRSLEGVWGGGDRDCAITTQFSVMQGEDGLWRVRSVSGADFDETMQVGTIDPERGIVTARATRPDASGARGQWEFRPDGEAMQVIDPAGTTTPLGRCGD